MRGSLHALVRDRFLPFIRSLSVAFIYESLDSHRHATAAYEFLLQEIQEDSSLAATWWRTSLVSDPKLSRVAARSIGASDLIVVSVASDSMPSPLVRQWIESWPIAEGRAPKLLVLLQGSDDDDPQPSEWDLYLRDFAARRNVLYLHGSLADTFSVPRPESAEPWKPYRPIDPYVHWGLNE